MDIKQLCLVCGEGYATAHMDQVESEYKGQKAMVCMHFQVCDVCTSDYAGAEESRLNKRAVMAFRKSVDGLLTGTEIRALREKYNLTQGQAAKLFGGGPVAFSKYENDDVAQSEPMDKLLRLVRRSDSAFWEQVDECGMMQQFVTLKTAEVNIEGLTTVTVQANNVVELAHFRGKPFRKTMSATYTTTANETRQWKR